jgi:hypothetical protein
MLRDFFKDIVTLKWRKIEEFLFFDGPQTYFIDRTRRAPSSPPLKLEKNMICWRKIVIFHTKYPKIFRASLHSAQLVLRASPLT